jgi:hypothetical protein
LFRLAIALLVMPAETSINAEPAAHIPNCRRDRCEKIDLSSAADGDGGADGWFPADAILCYALEMLLSTHWSGSA